MGLLPFSSSSDPPLAPPPTRSANVPLQVDLQDGFAGEPVTLRLNGAEVFSAARLNTRQQIGLAETVSLEVAPGEATIQVTVGRGRIADQITVRIASPIYVGVSVTGQDRLRFRVSETPFGYL